jgi:predicted NAD/FAD-dependent oxidoreductase
MTVESSRSCEVLVVGAGIAGLACARALREAGVDVCVAEKSRGVGGRCATRRVEGTPVDHGLAFYHGEDPEFLAALRAVEPDGPFAWPRRIHGSGPPCQPRSFRPHEQRRAFAAGVSSFPKHLARGVPVDLETRVARLERTDDRLVATTESGATYVARAVILALPAGQVPDLLKTLAPDDSPSLATMRALLSGISMVRCLTVLAGYPEDSHPPDWDVCYPEESDILQLVSQDSNKRKRARRPVFVFQARPRWSAEHWDDPPERWRVALLEAARPLCGEWVARPDWVDSHRWRYARLSGGDSLTAPVAVRLGNGALIGATGEAMSVEGGAQGAWLAGRRMASRLLGEFSE